MRQRQSQGQGRWVLGKADKGQRAGSLSRSDQGSRAGASFGGGMAVPVDEVRVLEFVRTGAARGMLGMFARALFGRKGCGRAHVLDRGVGELGHGMLIMAMNCSPPRQYKNALRH